jgi:hypothetical protein
VKSVISTPLDGAFVKLGDAVVVAGVAWSGDKGPITSVDLSTDGGRSWRPATLDQRKTQFGWRPWSFSFRPDRESYYNVMARATDASGDSQPFAQEWNPSGYGWNAVQRVGVNVAENPEKPVISLGGGRSIPPDATFKDTCLTCHEVDVIAQQRLTRAQWDREITKMTNWGAPVKPENRDAILNYLAERFGPRPR